MAEHNQEALARLRRRYEGGNPDRARIVDDLAEAHDRLRQEAGGHHEDDPVPSPRDDELYRKAVDLGRLLILGQEIGVLAEFVDTEIDERYGDLYNRIQEPATVIWDDPLRGPSGMLIKKGSDGNLMGTVSKAL